MENSNILIEPSICVLLSLFNGSPYIEEQIISLSMQKGVQVFIFARDDGSIDDTPNLFKAFCLRHGIEHKLICDGRNLGPAMSFFELLRSAPDCYDFYALCDQDDFWLPHKLRRAADHLLREPEVPSIYASSLAVTEADLCITRLRSVPNRSSLPQALIENHITGCSAVMNRAGLESLIPTLPSSCIMHDWWIYIHFCAVGRVIFDQNASILYRQHNTNHVGMNTSNRLSLRERFRRHFCRYELHQQVIQAKEYLNIAGEKLGRTQREIIERYVSSLSSFWSRLHLALDSRFRRTRAFDTFIWRVLVILNRH